MHTTSLTLLQRLRQPGAQRDWERFVLLYTPLLYNWACRLGLQDADAADLVQDVFVLLLRRLPEFTYDPGRSFRGWLRTVLTNKWRERVRARAASIPLADAPGAQEPAGPDPSEAECEAEFQRQLAVRALKLMQAHFQPTTWKACWEFVVCGRPAAAVARELNISVNAVYLAKGHVLRRLRQEFEGLLD
jgi:RNA polymerase sigma-70 factor (ECF subfamily)